MKIYTDIDIDLADREKLIKLINVIPASIKNTNNQLVKHNTGVYATDIPFNPMSGLASIDYQTAEKRGYMKIDLLNLSIYNNIKSEQHLHELMHTEPDWSNLKNPEFVKQLIHIGNHYDVLCSMPESVDSVYKLAMLLAIIRPSKRHLIGKTWQEIQKTIWDKDGDGYIFKKAHAIAYSHVVVINMNLLAN